MSEDLKTFYIATHQLVPRSSISIYLAAESRAFRVLAQAGLKIWDLGFGGFAQ